MRTIFSIIALFSFAGLAAQQYIPSEGRELPRCKVIAYPTAREAAAADGSDNRYFSAITEWTRDGNVFSTPFTVPFAWANRQILLRLGSAPAAYEVRINGRKTAYNADGNTPAEFNITRQAKEGRNTLEIVLAEPAATALESWKQPVTPTLGQAWVMSQPTLRVRDVVVKTWPSNDTNGSATAEIGLVIRSSALNPRTSRFYYELLTPAGELAATGHKDFTLDMRREDTLRFLARIPDSLLWSAVSPVRYTLRLKTQHEGRYDEYMEYQLGFRSIGVRNGRMAVNEQPVTLRAYEAAPQKLTKEDLGLLREEGYNTLRLLPGAMPEWLLDRCDSLGIYVIAQAPVDTRNSGESRRRGGNPSNAPAWQQAFIERTENSYHTTKRHPSVIAFSLARESANGINLYESYLNMKRYDDTRPMIYPEAAGEWNSDKLEVE